jgi:hypothetical protein
VTGYYEGIEAYLKKNPDCVLKVGHCDHGFLATFQKKVSHEKGGPNGRMSESLDVAIDTLEERCKE